MLSGAECAVCTSKSLSLVKLRRLNTICLTCLCLLGLGTAALSAFFLLKYRSLRRRLAELESRMDEMSDQLDEVGTEDTYPVSPRPSIMSLISSSSSSDLFDSTRQVNRLNNKTTPRPGILKKSVSFGSDLDSSSARYETPPSSPVSFHRFDIFADYQDDNKSLELIQSEDYGSLKRLASDKQNKYEMVWAFKKKSLVLERF